MNNFSAKNNVHFEDLDELKEKNETFMFGRTNFAFMDRHFGFRPGCLHVIHSKTSGGKTTLARCILCNISGSNKVLWIATEESISDWKLKFNAMLLPIARNIKFISEDDLKTLSNEEYFLFMERQIEELGEGIIIFDNITTSHFYNDKRPNEQSEFITRLKSLLKKEPYKVSMLLVAHFNGDARLPMFTSKDVRGSKTLPNIAEYWYNLHRLRIDVGDSSNEISLLHVEKSRSHSNSDQCYQLTYDKKLGVYSRDLEVSWSVAKELIDKQVKIGGKK